MVTDETMRERKARLQRERNANVKAARPVKRRLPIAQGHLVPTFGMRRDCARYDVCLDAFVSAHPHGDKPASCPAVCIGYAPPRHARATEYASSGREAGGE